MGKIMRVLLIEDDLDDQLLFNLAVTDASGAVVCSFESNGPDALSRLREDAELPDLIFLDLNMPIMHGFECLRALKADIRLSKIPIIIISTSNNTTDILKAKEFGAAGYLNKPNDLTLLKSILTDLLKTNFDTAPFYL